MSKPDIVQLALEWIDEYSVPFDENELDDKELSRVTDFSIFGSYKYPNELWDFVLEVISRSNNVNVLGNLAAGPLEDLISTNDPEIIRKVRIEAMKSSRFRTTLTGVWRNAINDENWRLIQQLQENAEQSLEDLQQSQNT